MYADDLIIYTKGKNSKSCQKLLQTAILNLRLENWSSKNGLITLKTKTKCIVFSKSTTETTLFLKLKNKRIPEVNSIKILGVTFDKQLTWQEHVENLKIAYIKDLNLLRILANNKCGADTTTLLHVYQSLICSKIDYGLVAYSTATKKVLKTIEVLQNSAYYKTTPAVSLYCLSGELPLHARKKLLLSTLLVY